MLTNSQRVIKDYLAQHKVLLQSHTAVVQFCLFLSGTFYSPR